MNGQDEVIDPDLASRIESTLATLWSDPSVDIDSLLPFGDGHSGFTYSVRLHSSRVSGDFVVRLSPPGSRIAGPADVGRQGRIMSALFDEGLPAPHVLASDSDGLTNGRALALMERVDGVSWQLAADTIGDRGVAELAVSFLLRARDLSAASVGLADEEPMTLMDELQRWKSLLTRCPDWLQAPGAALYDDLSSCVPESGQVGLVHGDFHYGNLLFRDSALSAVLDWEIATLGDPRLDFGCLAVASLRRRYSPEPNPTGDVGITLSQLAELYGMDLEVATWFTAATCLKYVAILGYNLGLHRRGRRIDPIYDQLTGTMLGLAIDGRRLIQLGPSAW